MTSRRAYAAGIIHAKSFMIFGGSLDGYGNGKLSSTELITEEGHVSPGPDMPAGIYLHAIAGVNETTSVLTGGYTTAFDFSPLTWYFNHVSQKFHLGPSLITGRRRHASGTIQDHETKEYIVVVIGGVNYGFLDSTELLITGEWQQGKICLFASFVGVHFSKMKMLISISFLFCYISGPQMSKRLCCLSAAQLGGDLYTIGGYDFNNLNVNPILDETYETAIQKLSCSSHVCTWSTIHQQLKAGRRYTVAIPVLDSLCTPTTPTTTTTKSTSTTATTKSTITTTKTKSTTTTKSTTSTTANVISSKKINTNMTVFDCLKARSRRLF